MDAAPGRVYIPRMPDISLSLDELQAAAMACRSSQRAAELPASGNCVKYFVRAGVPDE
jgi:hypothetical protein